MLILLISCRRARNIRICLFAPSNVIFSLDVSYELTVIRIRLARFANCNVEKVSSMYVCASCTVAIMTVLPLPPNASCNRRVNELSRYGICFLFDSSKADTTLPRAANDELIFTISFSCSSRRLLSLFIFLALLILVPSRAALHFSLPAKSTKLNVLFFNTINPSSSGCSICINNCNMV